MTPCVEKRLGNASKGVRTGAIFKSSKQLVLLFKSRLLDKLHSFGGPPTPAMSAQMATRIFVMCKTETMPGSDVEKIPLMANAACQKVWNRDFNGDPPDEDRLTSFGGWMNPKCFLLIDNGPVDMSYTLVKLRWNGQKLLDDPTPLHWYIQKEFDTNYQFNPKDRPKNGLTDEELEELLGPHKFAEVINSSNEMTARHVEKLRKQT
ncbi:hypothetical protein DL98DRAFT_110717 [Cadophora sp. DSE1049]|nr:hypothetical protein DL98DRAFT_110717 [Cadophora sp. DSE1049]